MTRQVVVLGCGVGGLSAAIHLRLRGFDVLAVEKGPKVGGKACPIERDGFRLDPGPSIIILTWIYEELFREAGRRPEDYLRFHKLDPISRVFFPGLGAVDLPSELDRTLEVLAEIAPEDVSPLRELVAKLDQVGPAIRKTIFAHPYDRPWQLLDPGLVQVARRFDVRKSYKELVDGWFRSPLLRSFFYGFPSYGGQTYDSKAAGALMIPYLMLREGVWWPEGGVGAIPASLERLARELGVEFRTETEVSGLVIEGGAAQGVRTVSGETIRSDAVVSNLDRHTVGSWLGESLEGEPSLSYFTLHWGLRRKLPGLAHHTLMIPTGFEEGFAQLYRDSKFPDSPIVYLNATAETDPDTAPPGCENLFAVVTSPAQQPHIDWEAQAEEFRHRTLATLREHGYEIDPSDMVFERRQDPNYFASAHGNFKGSLYGRHERDRLWGLFPPSNEHPKCRNLFFCGGSVQPGAGLPMVTLSGRFAAVKAARRLGGRR